MKKKLAIIGAGIAGLTLANFIKKYSDHEFMVYEREESLSLEEGYGIQLATNGIKILNQISFNKINNEKIAINKDGIKVKNANEMIYFLFATEPLTFILFLIDHNILLLSWGLQS